MGAARSELDTRLDEVLAAAHFMDRAYRLRPRVGQAIRWQDGPRDEVDLLRAFMVNDRSREEEILCALYLRTVAAFERYIRRACAEFVEARAKAASQSGTLPTGLKNRNLVMSARLLTTVESPADHISFNPAELIMRLAACERKDLPYQLNSVSFSATIQSPNVETIERIFSGIGLTDLFERLGRSATLQRHLKASGTRATNTKAKERLGEIVRWRNNFAHAGDDERTVSIDELDSVITFLRIVSVELDQAITDRVLEGFS